MLASRLSYRQLRTLDHRIARYVTLQICDTPSTYSCSLIANPNDRVTETLVDTRLYDTLVSLLFKPMSQGHWFHVPVQAYRVLDTLRHCTYDPLRHALFRLMQTFDIR